ncbi:MerR family transcriptional regulator [Desulfitobacterium sp. Sab5]|uniref:MerR family transcriptional regulator n=1 Tax=Desulfitobacterium nosdiversum TaxID=3375356 RepID=UPI003CF8015D
MYTISQFSRIGMISAKTLRFYDEIGLLKPIYVENSNQYRYYSPEQVTEVLRISEYKEYGFSLEKIKTLLKIQDPLILQQTLEEKLNEVSANLDHLSNIKQRIQRKISKLMEGDFEMFSPDRFDVSIKEKAPINTLSLRRKISIDNICSLIDDLFASLKNVQSAGPIMTIYHDPDFNPDHTDVEVCVPIRTSSSIPDTRVIPGGTHACVIYQGPYSDIGTAYAALMDWIPNNGYMPIGAPFEIYLTGPNDVKDEQKFVTEICFPVKKNA